jgi:aspartate aminotransferase-like enzyme
MKKHYLITPGPTPIPPEVSAKEGLPILHHRTSEFGTIFLEVLENLKYVFQTKNDVLLLTASGTGSMEASAANLVSPGETAIVASTGNFGDRWAKLLDTYGAKVVLLREIDGQSVDIAKVQDALRKNPDAKAVFTQHTETSTGVVNDIKTLGSIISQSNALLVVDAISGLVGQELRMDDWKVDVVVTGSQKGLMTAPGLSFTSLSPRAWAAVEASKSPRFYFDYRRMKKALADKGTPFTPGVTLIVALAEALRQIRQEGLENVWARHTWLANATRAGVKAMGLTLFAKTPCDVLTSITVPAGIEGKKIVKRMREEHGVSIAGGQGELVGKIVRLAHMGYMDRFDIITALSSLEMILSDMGAKIELGKGVGAAQQLLVKGPAGTR